MFRNLHHNASCILVQLRRATFLDFRHWFKSWGCFPEWTTLVKGITPLKEVFPIFGFPIGQSWLDDFFWGKAPWSISCQKFKIYSTINGLKQNLEKLLGCSVQGKFEDWKLSWKRKLNARVSRSRHQPQMKCCCILPSACGCAFVFVCKCACFSDCVPESLRALSVWAWTSVYERKGEGERGWERMRKGERGRERVRMGDTGWERVREGKRGWEWVREGERKGEREGERDGERESALGNR